MPQPLAQTPAKAKHVARLPEEEIKILLTMCDGFVLEKKEAIYASSELTTGQRYYALCRKYNVRTKDQLKAALRDQYAVQLLQPNEKAAIEFARSLREFNHRIVLTPNTLVVPDWTQPEYLKFWETVIQQKCRAIYLNEAWEFSNGCTFEYLVGHRAGMPLFDRDNQPLPPQKAKQMILRAIEELEADGFEVTELRKVYESL
jgi:hypothetical protein